MRARDNLTEFDLRGVARQSRPPSGAQPNTTPLLRSTLLALQRSRGNAAVCRALDDRATAADAPGARRPVQPARETVTTAQRYDFSVRIRIGKGDAHTLAQRPGLANGDARFGAQKQLGVSRMGAVTGEPEPAPGAAAHPAAEAPGGAGVTPEGGAAAAAGRETPAHEEAYHLSDIVMSELKGWLVCTDAVRPQLTITPDISRGRLEPIAFGEFGQTAVEEFRVTNILVTPNPTEFEVKANFELRVKWDTYQSVGPLGQLNVESPDSPVITAKNYTKVAADLTPDTSDHGGAPPRDKFWAQDLTERHEQYHANDLVQHFKAAVLLASTWLSGQTAADPARVEELVGLAGGMAEKHVRESYPPESEERAYGDGVAAYRKRASDISALGEDGKYPDTRPAWVPAPGPAPSGQQGYSDDEGTSAPSGQQGYSDDEGTSAPSAQQDSDEDVKW